MGWGQYNRSSIQGYNRQLYPVTAQLSRFFFQNLIGSVLPKRQGGRPPACHNLLAKSNVAGEHPTKGWDETYRGDTARTA